MLRPILTTVAALALLSACGRQPPAEAEKASPPATPVATAPQPADTHPPDALIEWEQSQGARTYRIGGLKLDLSWTEGEDDLGQPVLTVTAPDGSTGRMTGVAGFPGRANARFGVGRLSAGSPWPQVLMLTYSGGAHCCITMSVLEHRDGAWRVTRSEGWDSDGLAAFPTDIDGDGQREFAMADNRFLYAFTAYAGSYPAAQFLRFENGAFRDVSAEPGLRPQYQKALPRLREMCEAGENGVCPAYVATAARVGRFDEAWTVMLRSYNRNDNWPVPQACRTDASPCPDSAKTTFSYPESLQWFLGDAGYIPASYVEPLNATGPAFVCRKAATRAERAICASPTLAATDRAMAVAYIRALALSTDRPGLRRAQQGFLRERDRLTDPAVIEALYRRRIAALSPPRPA